MADALAEGRSERARARAAREAVEAEAIAEILRRGASLRRRLLYATLALSLAGAAGGVALYVLAAERVYGRVAGAIFAVAGIGTFAIVHRAAALVVARYARAWVGELSSTLDVDRDALADAAKMLG